MIFWMSITARGSIPAKGSSRRMKDGLRGQGPADLQPAALAPESV